MDKTAVKLHRAWKRPLLTVTSSFFLRFRCHRANGFISEWILRLRSGVDRVFEPRVHWEAFGGKLPPSSHRRQLKRITLTLFCDPCLFFLPRSLVCLSDRQADTERAASPSHPPVPLASTSFFVFCFRTSSSSDARPAHARPAPLYVGALRAHPRGNCVSKASRIPHGSLG